MVWVLLCLLSGCGLSCRGHTNGQPHPAAPVPKPVEEIAVTPTGSNSSLPPIPYRQPYANPGRNSAEPLAFALRDVPKWVAAFTASDASVGGINIDWLLGGGGSEQLVLYDAAWGRGWWVDLHGVRAMVRTNTGQGGLLAYQEDADQLLMTRGAMLLLPDMKDPIDDERWQVVGASGMTSPVQALVPRQQRFIVMSLFHADRFNREPRIMVTSKPYTPGGGAGLLWQQTFPGELGGPSPALSDDTLILCRESGLTYLAADGAGVVDPAIGIAQAKVVALVGVGLRPGLVSADALDRVWGFRLEDGALVGWDRTGESLGAALPLDEVAVQPPVALPNGAVAVIAPGVVLKVENSGVRWRAELPPDAHPLATADSSGQLLVRAGKQLLLIDAAGKRVWTSELPAAITSNPLVTRSGRLCVGVGLTLYCSQ